RAATADPHAKGTASRGLLAARRMLRVTIFSRVGAIGSTELSILAFRTVCAWYSVVPTALGILAQPNPGAEVLGYYQSPALRALSNRNLLQFGLLEIGGFTQFEAGKNTKSAERARAIQPHF